MAESGDDSGPSEKDFHCSCCYELMVDATTLNCGHSFCRFCLAQWWYSSKKTTCPECRQAWPGFPSTNILLRKTIKKLFPAELVERRISVESQPKYQKIINKFESFGKNRNDQNHRGISQGQPNRWVVITKTVAIVAGILGVLMFFYDLFGILFSSNEPLVRKPLEAWSPSDVSLWVSSLGPWSKEISESKFQEMGINGKILKSLTESDLEDLLSIDKPYQRHALLSEIDHLKMLGVKPPTDLWEYKAAYPARCMFLLWGFREFPRATAIYTYFALHDEVFLPLLYYTSEHMQDSNYSLDINDGWHPPALEYGRFLVRVLFTPYYLIGKFAFQWVHINSWAVGVIIMFCGFMSAAELLHSCWLLMGGWKKLPSTIWKNTKAALFNGALHLIIWHFIPSFIFDIVFYWMLFVGPLYAWNSLKDSFNSQRLSFQGSEENYPLDIARLVCSWVWRKITTRLGINT